MLREQTLARHIQPVLCGSGREHIGIQPLHGRGDAITCPARSTGRRWSGTNPEEEGQGGEAQARPEGAVLRPGLQDRRRHARRLFYLRIYSGTLKANSRVLQPGPRRQGIRQQDLPHPRRPASDREELPEAYAGDIVAIIGPKDSITGDTLCDPQHPIVLEQIKFAEAVVSQSIEPESSADKDKLVDVARIGSSARTRPSPGASTPTPARR